MIERSLAELIGTNAAAVLVTVIILVALFKRELRRFDEAIKAISALKDRVLIIENKLPDIAALRASIISEKEGKAIWKRVDEIKDTMKEMISKIEVMGERLIRLENRYDMIEWHEEDKRKGNQ